MSYINRPSITLADSPNVDAFQRLRISEPTTIFDSKFLRDIGMINWVSQSFNNATASYFSSSVLLVTSASTSAPSFLVRQSRRRFNYQSGKSQLVINTANFVAADANTIKRVGYFDQNNGVYFVYTGSQFGVGYRSNGVDTFVSQSNWNLDTYNGLGASGNILNITASQIYFTDFEWLGVGRVRWGIFQGGIPTYIHQLTNINALPYNAPVYMANPNNPIRYELINSGSTTSSLVQICSTVVSEGGFTQAGAVFGVDNLGTPINVFSGSYVALLALQYSGSGGSINNFYETIIPTHIGCLSQQTSSILKWSILLNPTVGGAAFAYNTVSNSVLVYATGSTTSTITNEGTKIASGYLNFNQSDLLFDYDPSLSIGSTVGGVSDVLVLAVANYSGVNNVPTSSVFGSIGWQETI